MNIVAQADVMDWDEMSIVIARSTEKRIYLYVKVSDQWITTNQLLYDHNFPCQEDLKGYDKFADLADWFQEQ